MTKYDRWMVMDKLEMHLDVLQGTLAGLQATLEELKELDARSDDWTWVSHRAEQ